MTNKILMPEALTAANGGKCLIVGEFHSDVRMNCLECDGLGHEDTEEMEVCDE